ncbi:MAG TPA: hypothetical protein DCX25_02085 [Candidatus Pacebacteria bacterium]|nr:MAG: Septum formation initiator [Microgenomates group bacterium GW2011_GWB1_45_17]KKU23159.1 MAG: Septum formation initiator [Microgenomates group bacterium GW2011_GWA1_46_15]KKU23822.1 MAG: Septum formation initiator [Microgenomates group bacterium GW2011_GWC1_46_15]HAV15095.1 hypothetical protein [Candidatus Paceibacterota bacterium]HCR11646.1 hypothetical protein [Candidatus Paceibacterota bacterium]
MKFSQNFSQKRPFLFSRIFFVIWLIFCASVSVSLTKSLFSIVSSQSRVRVLEKQHAELERKNAGLEQKITNSRTPFAKESIIRNELGLQKPNEVVVQVPDSATPAAEEQKNENPSVSEPIYRQWITLFFGS